MFGIKRDDFTKMSMYNLQDLMIAYSVSTIEKKLLAFTFPHLRMFTLYCLVCLLSPARALDDLGHFEGVSAFGVYFRNRGRASRSVLYQKTQSQEIQRLI